MSMYVFPVGMIECLLLLCLCYGDVVSFTGACGVEVSDVYMVNNVGDRTPPCGTSV